MSQTMLKVSTPASVMFAVIVIGLPGVVDVPHPRDHRCDVLHRQVERSSTGPARWSR
ncbi:MAG: hypothetical protein R3C02_24340 [Planctomycetaceae bacterium]